MPLDEVVLGDNEGAAEMSVFLLSPVCREAEYEEGLPGRGARMQRSCVGELQLFEDGKKVLGQSREHLDSRAQRARRRHSAFA